MTRILTPTPTRGPAPSHAPPDMRYAPGIDLARCLGWVGIGLGLAELFAPRAVANLTGVRNETLIQAFGLREIATGIGILTSEQPANWMWARVAGDVIDLATLASTLGENGNSTRPLVAMTLVAGVAISDALAATELSVAAALEG